jgi:glycerol uptake facilitator-like aquaporin
MADNSGFTEIKESASISPNQLEAQPSDAIEEVPIDDRWSWNPMDWYTGIKHEVTEFDLAMTEKKRVMIRAVFGEGLVTFLFMFIVMATAVNNGRQENPENLVLGCISTAFASVALIYSFADVSGAHFNPAVTFATVITGKMSVRKGFLFIGIQMFSAVFATLALLVVFPGIKGSPKSSIASYVTVEAAGDSNLVNAFFMEVALTFVLVYVIFATAFDTGNRILCSRHQGSQNQGTR